MPIIPFAEFAPDMPDIAAPFSDTVLNVLPRTPTSYEPFRAAVQVSDALAARCQGAATMQDESGNVRIFAGDEEALYRLASGSTFTDVSKAGGYATSPGEFWNFALFGNRVIATNYADTVQSYVEGTSTKFADMIATGITGIKARYVATVKNFLVLANTDDGTFGTNPQRVWWSAIEDPTDFPTPGTSTAAARQSDYQDVVGNHGWCQGIVGNLGNADAAIFFERAVYRMTYVGPPAIFDIRAAEGVVGCPAPGSIVQFRSSAYYLGEDGFYQFDGSSSRAIGKNKVDRFVFDEIEQASLSRVVSAVDPSKPIIYWAYPTSGASNCNRILAYNWNLDRWSITEVDAVVIEALFRSLTLGTNTDALDSIFANVDATDALVDSREFTGGRLVLSGFDTSHKLVRFNGSALEATIDTQDSNIFDGKHGIVTQVRPIVDGGTPTVAIGYRDVPTALPTFSTEVAVGSTGIAPVRARGRYLRARVGVPAGSNWTHASGIEIVKSAPLGVR